MITVLIKILNHQSLNECTFRNDKLSYLFSKTTQEIMKMETFFFYCFAT